jgi:hypothetical protein
LFRICQVLRLRPGPREPGHPQADTRRVFVCACTHYLVFKEPAASPPTSRRAPERPSVREPSNVTAAGFACQPLISWQPTFSFGAPRKRPSPGEPYEITNPWAPCQHLFAPTRIYLGLPRNQVRLQCGHPR